MKKNRGSKANNKAKEPILAIFFNIVVTVFFLGNNSHALNLKQFTKLQAKRKLSIGILLIIAFLLYFVYSSFKEPLQIGFRKLFTPTKGLTFQHVSDRTLKILILPFQEFSSGSSEFQIEKVIQHGLLIDSETNNLDIDVLYDSTCKPPVLQSEAKDIGELKNADVVIYGLIDSQREEFEVRLLITTRFYETFSPLQFTEFSSSGIKKKLEVSSIIKLDSLNEQKYILYNIMGLNEIRNLNCSNAANLFNQAISTFYFANSRIERETHSLYQSNCGTCFFNTNNLEDALVYYNVALKNNPNNEEALFMRAIINVITKDFISAYDDFNTLKQFNTEYNAYIYYMSGVINYMEKGNFEEGIRDLEISRLFQKEELSLPVADFFLSILEGNVKYDKIESFSDYPKDLLLEYYMIAVSLIYDGNINGLINIVPKIKRTITNNKRFNTNYPEQGSNYNYYYQFFGGDELDTLNKHILSLNTPNSNILNAINILFNPEIESDDFSNIKKLLKKAIKQNPDFKYYYTPANLLKDSVVRIKTKIDSLKSIYSINSSDYISLIKISDLYEKIGHKVIADYYANKAIATNILSVFYLPNKYYNLDELNLYKKEFIQIESISNKDKLHKETSFYSKGRILRELGYYSQAKKEYLKDLSLSPTHFNCLTELAYIYYYEKDYITALDYHTKAIKVNPNSFYPYYNRYFTFRELNQTDKALEDINKAIDLFNQKESKLYNIKIEYLYKLKDKISGNQKNSLK